MIDWKEFKPVEPGEYLHKLISAGELSFEGYLTVIDNRQIRQRKIGDTWAYMYSKVLAPSNRRN